MSIDDNTKLHTKAALRTSCNMFGFRGVTWRSDRGSFTAEIGSAHNGTRKRIGGYSTAIEAAIAYDEMARERYGDIASLNFPTEEENKVRKSRLHEGFCPDGHDLNKYGRHDHRGTLSCRKCNIDAVKKWKFANQEKVRGYDRKSNAKRRNVNVANQAEPMKPLG